ncbi:unnamed protein product [Schistosoma bovis]|nr:unnamed protein product [Schistosoma mattheei]CAH8479851.1 unnamed protein product [Schistosoma intercalatum]CAH8487499.1 unnamed protein product [Schistosoma bovis]CAH8488284.1 unnamed protein product [Schistosoma haematobium]VDP68760.1 unnamed protein product [Schistosoma curassoni]
MSSKSKRHCNSVLWFITLIIFAIPISLCLSWIYILLIICNPCSERLTECTESLLKVIQWPWTCAQNMLRGESYLECCCCCC